MYINPYIYLPIFKNSSSLPNESSSRAFISYFKSLIMQITRLNGSNRASYLSFSSCKISGAVKRHRGGPGGRAERSHAVGYQPIKTCCSIPTFGHGIHHGHPKDQTIRRSVGRSASLGLRGSFVEISQGRGAQGAKAAVRSVWSVIWQKLYYARSLYDIYGLKWHHQVRNVRKMERKGVLRPLDYAWMRLRDGHRRQYIPAPHHQTDGVEGLRQGSLQNVTVDVSGRLYQLYILSISFSINKSRR